MKLIATDEVHHLLQHDAIKLLADVAVEVRLVLLQESSDFGPSPKSEQDLTETLAKLREHEAEVSELVSDIWAELRK